jgi:FkbM family methyltransferase
MFPLFRTKVAPPAKDFPPEATEQDILACFRLLLGRPPNPEEWRGHAGHAGNLLESVVSLYLTSHEFAARGLFRPQLDPRIKRAEGPGFHIFVDENDLAVGRQVAHGVYEPDVAAVMRRYILPGMSIIDIGANIGYFSLLAATVVGAQGHVLAVEPNPRNARMLEASSRSNGFNQILVLQIAAGRDTGLLVLNTTHSNGTTSDAPPDLAKLLSAETVACFPLDLVVRQPVQLIKVDVEGAEYNALLGCRRLIARDHPVIVTEFSPGMLSGVSHITGPDYLRWLTECGYVVSVIEADGSTHPADVDGVMQAYARRGSDHINLVALP